MALIETIPHPPPMCVYWDSRFIRPVEDWKLGAVGLSSILKEVKGCSNGLDLSCSHGVGSNFDNLPCVPESL